MKRKAPSMAQGKRFGSTMIAIEKSQFDIQRLLTKWDCEASQWTFTSESYTLRFRLEGRNYIFKVPVYEEDPQETRRLLRVIYWYLDTMLAAQDAGLFTPERVFLAFLEVAPEVTLSEVLGDPVRLNAVRGALGGARLQLEDGGA